MANPTPIPVPKGYQRLNNFPLDASSVFSTLSALTAYADTSPVAYAGQVCVDTDAGKAYVIKADGSVSNISDVDGGEI